MKLTQIKIRLWAMVCCCALLLSACALDQPSFHQQVAQPITDKETDQLQALLRAVDDNLKGLEQQWPTYKLSKFRALISNLDQLRLILYAHPDLSESLARKFGWTWGGVTSTLAFGFSSYSMASWAWMITGVGPEVLYGTGAIAVTEVAFMGWVLAIMAAGTALVVAPLCATAPADGRPIPYRHHDYMFNLVAGHYRGVPGASIGEEVARGDLGLVAPKLSKHLRHWLTSQRERELLWHLASRPVREDGDKDLPPRIRWREFRPEHILSSDFSKIENLDEIIAWLEQYAAPIYFAFDDQHIEDSWTLGDPATREAILPTSAPWISRVGGENVTLTHPTDSVTRMLPERLDERDKYARVLLRTKLVIEFLLDPEQSPLAGAGAGSLIADAPTPRDLKALIARLSKTPPTCELDRE